MTFPSVSNISYHNSFRSDDSEAMIIPDTTSPEQTSKSRFSNWKVRLVAGIGTTVGLCMGIGFAVFGVRSQAASPMSSLKNKIITNNTTTNNTVLSKPCECGESRSQIAERQCYEIENPYLCSSEQQHHDTVQDLLYNQITQIKQDMSYNLTAEQLITYKKNELFAIEQTTMVIKTTFQLLKATNNTQSSLLSSLNDMVTKLNSIKIDINDLTLDNIDDDYVPEIQAEDLLHSCVNDTLENPKNKQNFNKLYSSKLLYFIKKTANNKISRLLKTHTKLKKINSFFYNFVKIYITDYTSSVLKDGFNEKTNTSLIVVPNLKILFDFIGNQLAFSTMNTMYLADLTYINLLENIANYEYSQNHMSHHREEFKDKKQIIEALEDSAYKTISKYAKYTQDKSLVIRSMGLIAQEDIDLNEISHIPLIKSSMLTIKKIFKSFKKKDSDANKELIKKVVDDTTIKRTYAAISRKVFAIKISNNYSHSMRKHVALEHRVIKLEKTLACVMAKQMTDAIFCEQEPMPTTTQNTSSTFTDVI